MSNYFEDQIATGKPIFPPPAPQSDTPSQSDTSPSEQLDQDSWKGLPVRVSGDRIWLLKDGIKRWVTSGEVYEKLGFKFGDEVKLDQATLDLIPESDPIR